MQMVGYSGMGPYRKNSVASVGWMLTDANRYREISPYTQTGPRPETSERLRSLTDFLE